MLGRRRLAEVALIGRMEALSFLAAFRGDHASVRGDHRQQVIDIM